MRAVSPPLHSFSSTERRWTLDELIASADEDYAEDRLAAAAADAEGDEAAVLQGAANLLGAVAGVPGVRPETPWKDGHQLEITARGGLYNLERRRVTVAAKAYHSRVRKNRHMHVSGDYTATVDGDASVTIAPGNVPVTSPGLEKLTVNGAATMEFGERRTILTGTVNRVWTGPIKRMIGMEGVICGGAFARIHAGPAMTVAALISGDVYGGAARVAGARIHVAGLGYRSADSATWAMGAYIRSTNFTIEPEVGTTTQTPESKMSEKIGRIAMGLCPFLEIGLGLLMLPIGIVSMLVSKIRRRQPKPPTGPPRVRTINGIAMTSTGALIHT